MGRKVYVVGVGMTKFIKPRGLVDYTELGFEAGVKALLDAKINYDDVDQGIWWPDDPGTAGEGRGECRQAAAVGLVACGKECIRGTALFGARCRPRVTR